MITAAEILKRADELVKARDRWAAYPSTDVGVAAVTEILISAVNAEIRDWVLRVIGALTHVHEPEAYNFALAELAKMIGEQCST